MNTLLFLLLGYLLGSLPFAVIVSRIFGLADPRSFGSGNPGATNVLRSGHKGAAVLTLFGDAAKGWAAVAAAAMLGADAWGVALAGLAAFLGHLYPLFLRFKGGKGVATAAGVLLGFSLAAGGAAVAIWGLVALFSRYSSLAALVAAAAVPLLTLVFSAVPPQVVVAVAMSALLIWRHRENIHRLLAGTESRIGKKKNA